MVTLRFHFEQIPQGENSGSGGNRGFGLSSTPYPVSSCLGAPLLSFCHSEAAAPMGISVGQVCYGVSHLKDS